MESIPFSILVFLAILALFYSFIWMRKDNGYEPKIVFITSLAGLIGLFSTFSSNNQTSDRQENISQEKGDESNPLDAMIDPISVNTGSQSIDSSLLLDSKLNRVTISNTIDFEIDGLGNIKVIKKDNPILGFGKYSEVVHYLIPIRKIKIISIPDPFKRDFKIIYNDGVPESIFNTLAMTQVFNESNFLYFIKHKLKPYNNKIIVERPLPDGYYTSKIFFFGLFFVYFLIARSIYRFIKS
jgi:hypothetical protein